MNLSMLGSNVTVGWTLLILGISSFAILTMGFRRLSTKLFEGVWRGKEMLKVIEVVNETHDIVKLGLARSGKRTIPNFLPGQFLSLQVGDDPKTIRSYSICSSNLKNDVVQIAVKRINGGVGSNWIHSLKVGDEVYGYPPSGFFTDTKKFYGSRVYVAGGIGVTPMVSMIKSNLENNYSGSMFLFYGMRSLQDMAFHEELLSLSKKHLNFNYFPFVAEPVSAWSGATGYVTYDAIKEKVGDILSAKYFVCGPNPMMESIIGPLLDAGVPEHNIITEKFVSPSTIDDSKVPYREVTVTIYGQKYSYKGQKNLLEFAESHGLVIPFSCRAGVCGSCRCQVTGRVEMLTEAGLSFNDKKKGYILSCVSYPKEDITLIPLDS